MSNTTIPPPPDGDRDHSHELLAIIWVEAFIGAVVMAARVFTKAYIAQNLWWEDLWMILTWVLTLVFHGIQTASIHSGVARHMYYLSPQEKIDALKLIWLSFPFAIASMGIGKIAFSVFLLRVVPKNKKRMRWFLHGYNALLIAVNIPLIVITYAQCSPVAGIWEPTINAKCWNPEIEASYAIFQGSYGAFSDLILALFPVTMIWHLQVPLKTRLLLMSLMCLGVFAAICAAVKTVYLRNLKARADFTWQTQYLFIWSNNEIYLIIIAATVPTLRPLFRWATSKSYRQSKYDEHHHRGPNSHRMSRLRSISPSANNRIQTDVVHGKRNSDSEILNNPEAIQKTTDVDISFDDGMSKGSKPGRAFTFFEDDGKPVRPEDRV